MMQVDLMLIDTGKPSLSSVKQDLLKDQHTVHSFQNIESLMLHALRRNITNLNHQHRCVLLTHQMDGMSGLEAQEHLRKIDPGIVSLIYSHAPTPICIIEAWRSGVDDYFIYPFDSEELKTSLHRIVGKRLTYSRGLEEQSAGIASEPFQSLTTREREIMLHITQGQKNSQICEALNISPATVKMHRANLMRKLSVHNAAQLTTYFHKHIKSLPKSPHPLKK